MPNWKKVIVSGSDASLSSLSLKNLGSQNEIVIVGANNQISSSNLLAIDTVNNRVGIGTSSPEVKLHIDGDAAQEAQIRLEQHNDTADAPDIRIRRSRGTHASPSTLAANDYMFRLNVDVYDGSSYVNTGNLRWDNDGTTANNGTNNVFGIQTRVAGTTADRLTIDSKGNTTFSGEITGSALQVGGVISATNTITVDSPGNARLVLDRAANANDSEIEFKTNGTTNWSIGTGQVGGESNFTFKGQDGTNYIRINQSGQADFFSAVTSSGLEVAGISYPTSDGTSDQVLRTDGAGNLSFVDQASENVTVTVKNVSGTTLTKGTPVHVTGSSGNTSEVIAASASVASSMPATFVLGEDLINDAEGDALIVGFLHTVCIRNRRVYLN